MARRPEDFDLRAALRSPGFTPGARDVPALLGLLASDDEAASEAAGRALGRADRAAGAAVLTQAAAAAAPLRARLCRVLGRLAQRGVPGTREYLLERLHDPDDRTRRSAATALGHLGGTDLEAALLDAWAREARPEHRRALAAALGKTGGERALALLRGLDTDDPELRRIADRALLMLTRSRERGAPERLRLDRAPPEPLTWVARCRPGLEELLADELRPLGRPEITGPGAVQIRLAGPPEPLLRARILLQAGVRLPVEAGGDLAEAVARTLASPAARAVFAAFSEGTARFRLAWAGGGHRRAVTWRCARLVEERCPGLRNDPTGSGWEVVVDDRTGLRVELRPRRLPEGRCSYRKLAVPAASHPTVAAALARAGGVDPRDVVWDPFVGSGLELVERSVLGPYAALHGSDLDPEALVAARTNLVAAGCERFTLTAADACAHDPGGVTLILTNPPMGRRVARDGSLGALLDRFLDQAARVLRPGGRLVWLSPLPRRTAARLQAAGLGVVQRRPVDMGGFAVELQVARRR